ncbi:protein lev-9-like isoform X1 [Erpetoichthys calabaricus]|uniref:protein lev-9-like isoform X1 n=1 Tax=Erpetoichthys calabaricus TaxID=27687 RepID=UPI002234E956|nr:protein lev-9-like isoform X1 [Erpetoichthys calabaricus]
MQVDDPVVSWIMDYLLTRQTTVCEMQRLCFTPDDFCPIPFFENGMVTPEVGSSYSYGISAIFSCNDFYILEGPTTATCEIDRTWQPSPPVCVLDPCQVSGILNKMRCAKRKFVKWVKEKTSDFDF